MKNIKLLMVFCVVALNLHLHAQRATDELPYGLRTGLNAQVLDKVVLAAPDRGLIEKEDLENDQQPNPLRYAYPVHVNYTPKNSGSWQELENGSKIWQLKITIPGALATVTYYDRFWLPEGGEFFVYSEETRQSIGAIISDFIEGSLENPIEFATALIYGENVVYEYYQPASVTKLPVISISRIDYGYRYVDNPYENTPKSRDFGDAGDCNININCPQGQSWQSEKDAVARVSVVLPNGSGWCSCALINNTKNDNTPYVLTANHCLEGLDAESNNNASQWVFYWKYEHPGCTNSSTPPTLRTSTGATVIANNSASDFALLKINNIQHPALVTGVTPYYLGWDRSKNFVASGVGIHHPRGDVKKISLTNNISNFAFWKVVWREGTTERGSSGSPLINNKGRIIGQLYSGSANCGNLSGADYYGKFNVSWTGSTLATSKRRLKDWLDPGNTDVLTLNGKDCNLTLNNRTYNTGTHTLAGCVVTISNTTIEPNTTVRIHGEERVVLKSGFHAKAGSSVRITAGWQQGRGSGNSIDSDDEDSISKLKSLELAVEDSEIDNVDFSVYPNPNDGNFTVKVTGEVQPYTLEIFNSLGGLLGNVSCNDEIVNIDRTDLNAGVYYVKITMNEKVAVKKVIVQ